MACERFRSLATPKTWPTKEVTPRPPRCGGLSPTPFKACGSRLTRSTAARDRPTGEAFIEDRPPATDAPQQRESVGGEWPRASLAMTSRSASVRSAGISRSCNVQRSAIPAVGGSKRPKRTRRRGLEAGGRGMHACPRPPRRAPTGGTGGQGAQTMPNGRMALFVAECS